MDDAADWVSAIAAVIAVGISLFALGVSKTSARAAKDANNIQLHMYRRELFVAFHDLYTEFKMRGLLLKPNSVDGFSAASKTMHLYVSDALANAIGRFYGYCDTLVIFEISLNSQGRDLLTMKSGGYMDWEIEERENSIKKMSEDRLATYKLAWDLSTYVYEALKEEIRLDRMPKSNWQRFKEQVKKPYDWQDQQEPE